MSDLTVDPNDNGALIMEVLFDIRAGVDRIYRLLIEDDDDEEEAGEEDT